MDVELLSMSRKAASKEWKNYRAALTRRHEKYAEDLYKCYSQMKRGRKIVDIFQAMKATGLNDKEEPKLAIACLGWSSLRFDKSTDDQGGGGTFCEFRGYESNVRLPNGTFKEFSSERTTWGGIQIKNEKITTKIPIVPAQFLPKGDLKKYYILWEVDEWRNVPKDPILLKRLTDNLFAVLAVWDLSPLEQAIIRGKR